MPQNFAVRPEPPYGLSENIRSDRVQRKNARRGIFIVFLQKTLKYRKRNRRYLSAFYKRSGNFKVFPVYRKKTAAASRRTDLSAAEKVFINIADKRLRHYPFFAYFQYSLLGELTQFRPVSTAIYGERCLRRKIFIL